MARRSRRIGVLDLSKEIDAMFVTYGNQVSEVIDDAIKTVAEEAETELKAVQKFNPERNPSGVYSGDWTFTVEPVKRFVRKVVVYNDEHYRLTHLLENGHAVKRGGRVVGKAQSYEHIYPVNQKAQERFVEEIVERITELNS